jgi:hypothetical protein
MKKFILGLIVGAVLSVPATVLAGRVTELPWTNNIYNVSDVDESSNTTVSTFNDNGNQCYVVRNWARERTTTISCVKED